MHWPSKIQYLRVLLAILLLGVNVYAFQPQLDIINYHLTIEPDIKQEHVQGSVVIKYRLPKNQTSFTLDSGNLQIDEVKGNGIKNFSKTGNKLIIELVVGQRESINELTINYRGHPSKGLIFDPKNNQAHTVYFTDQWMVSNFSTSDKATMTMDIHVEKGLNCIANGKLTEVQEKEGMLVYRWRQDFESPAYTFGFVIGTFQKFEYTAGKVKIINYAQNYSPSQLQKIFAETTDMISFFENRSGIEYDQASYSQILIGNHYQELSGLSVLRESYGSMVLKDSTETNLIAHELAHQWWGNRITCKNLNHFWLNEALATYMSAAYNEQRFGSEKYKTDIDSYFKVYQEIRNRNKDRPLVFKDWSNPTRDDRNIVYFKGAYVLHLLRQEIGDQLFWDGIRYYSRKHFDGFVTTQDFQNAMEKTTGFDLDDFFNKWIY